MMVVEMPYSFGDLLYLKTDIEGHARMLTAIQVTINGTIIYKLSFGATETWHYEQEISTEKALV